MVGSPIDTLASAPTPRLVVNGDEQEQLEFEFNAVSGGWRLEDARFARGAEGLRLQPRGEGELIERWARPIGGGGSS